MTANEMGCVENIPTINFSTVIPSHTQPNSYQYYH